MSAESISGTQLESSVITGKKTAAVFFWATWDSASRTYMPSFEQVANEKSFSLSFYKFDIDSDAGTASKYGIRSVPTVQLFKGGQVVGQLIGALTKGRLDALVATV